MRAVTHDLHEMKMEIAHKAAPRTIYANGNIFFFILYPSRRLDLEIQYIHVHLYMCVCVCLSENRVLDYEYYMAERRTKREVAFFSQDVSFLGVQNRTPMRRNLAGTSANEY